MTITEMTIANLNEIKELFKSVFTAPPWNEDWSDERQLDEFFTVQKMKCWIFSKPMYCP